MTRWYGEMTRQRQRLRVDGVVQGVGFRPFVFNLAESLGLAGHVANDSEGVILEIEGDEEEAMADDLRLFFAAWKIGDLDLTTCGALAKIDVDVSIFVVPIVRIGGVSQILPGDQVSVDGRILLRRRLRTDRLVRAIGETHSVDVGVVP